MSSIKNNAENLLRLLNYFIDVSNLEIGEIVLQRQNLKLDEIIEKALCITQPIVQGYNTQVIQKIPSTPTRYALPI